MHSREKGKSPCFECLNFSESLIPIFLSFIIALASAQKTNYPREPPHQQIQAPSMIRQSQVSAMKEPRNSIAYQADGLSQRTNHLLQQSSASKSGFRTPAAKAVIEIDITSEQYQHSKQRQEISIDNIEPVNDDSKSAKKSSDSESSESQNSLREVHGP